MAVGDKIVISNKNNILLEKIKEVDGTDSGLDADLLRGLPADFTNDLSENGYQILPSGLIIQWGVVQSTSDDNETFTFPVAFPNSCFNTTITLYDADGAGMGEANIGNIVADLAVTEADFTVNRDDNIDGTPYFQYFAIGN